MQYTTRGEFRQPHQPQALPTVGATGMAACLPRANDRREHGAGVPNHTVRDLAHRHHRLR